MVAPSSAPALPGPAHLPDRMLASWCRTCYEETDFTETHRRMLPCERDDHNDFPGWNGKRQAGPLFRARFLLSCQFIALINPILPVGPRAAVLQTRHEG